MKAILMGALVTGALAMQLSAGSVSVTFTDANGQKDSSGYLISPYTAAVNGVSTTIYCDDFANSVSNGQSYSANETNLGSGNLSLTRYGGVTESLQTQNGTQKFDGQQIYEMAAWLTTQFAPNASANGNIQDTLWDLFDQTSGSNAAPKPSSTSWLFSAEQNYASVNASNFTILTNVNEAPSGNGQVQEFIMATPAISQAPEPASMGLLGLGMIALSIFGRRKLFPGAAARNESESGK